MQHFLAKYSHKILHMNPLVDQMSSFLVMDILERAHALQAQGIDIIHLEVGEPDFDVPTAGSEAILDAVRTGNTHYTHSMGSPELRQAIADRYKREHSVQVDPDCILITSGSSPALLLCTLLLCQPGSEVLLSNPGYACYRNFALAAQAKPVEYPLQAEHHFQTRVEDIRPLIRPQTAALFINTPTNPTGAIIPPQTLKELASLDIPIISDEIYHGLSYEQKASSLLEFTDQAFVVNGFSKRYAMTGLRLGYLIAPKQHMRALQTLQQNLFICAPSLAQRAGLAVLKHSESEVEQMRLAYRERRDYLLKRLLKMGFHIPCMPEGAFYIYCDARSFTDDSYAFAFEVLEHAHVGITPGVDFGSSGTHYVRFSYANTLENLREGMNRLETFLHNRTQHLIV